MPAPAPLTAAANPRQYKQTNQFLLNNFLKLAIIPIITTLSTTKLRNVRVVDDSTSSKLDELRLLFFAFLLLFIATIFFMSNDLYCRLVVLQASGHVPATILNLHATFEVESEEGGDSAENFSALSTLLRVMRVLLLFDIIASFFFM